MRMNKFFQALAVLAAVAGLFFAGCRKKPTLHLYCWADYVAPELIERFERENGCRVVYDTFDSNEVLLAKFQAGATGYDLIFPSHYVVDMLVKSGVVERLDKSRLSCLGHVDPDVLAKMPDKDCDYSVPYMISYTGIGYNGDVLKDIEPSWHLFERSDLQKRATLLDDKRETIGVALMTLGIDPNSTNPDDLAKAKELILKWLPNVSKFENEQYKNGLASKEFSLVMGYSGDIVQIMEDGEHVKFAIPKEGCTMACDVMAVPASAQNRDLAYKFIDFIHDPANAAENMEYTYYLCPNRDAYGLVSDELRSNPAVFVDRDVFSKCRFIVDQGENEKAFNELWDEIKNNK